MCKTYPQNWGQNVDNVDNAKVEHIFCATCLVYHKVGNLAEGKRFTWMETQMLRIINVKKS